MSTRDLPKKILKRGIVGCSVLSAHTPLATLAILSIFGMENSRLIAITANPLECAALQQLHVQASFSFFIMPAV